MTTPTFSLTPRQRALTGLLQGGATHIMAYGGSRSGKTFALTRAVLIRALKVEKSRHTILRFRLNHLKASIIMDTLPKVMDLCFPGVMSASTMNKTDLFLTLPNKSEIWFGGLDDKERTEKILGQEYATIYLNECSQIPWSSRNIAMTRLAQRTDLALKAYYDCNPPNNAHWTYRAFVEKIDPESRQPFSNPEAYASIALNPADNAVNLPKEYLSELGNLPEKMRRRFLLGEFVPSVEGALWTYELLDKHRYISGEKPQMLRTVIAVDPSGCSGDEDKRSDEVGIVVVAIASDGDAYVLEDLSGRYGPSQWGSIVASAFDRHAADAVVAETNYGGAMVEAVIQTARPDTPVRRVTASRGKHVRAEPVAALYEKGKVHHMGPLPRLEDQLCAFTTAGFQGDRSPDRADALIWGLTELFPSLTRDETESKFDFYGNSRGGWLAA